MMKFQVVHCALLGLALTLSGCQTTTYTTVDDSLSLGRVSTETSRRETKFAPDPPSNSPMPKTPTILDSAQNQPTPVTAALTFARELEQRNELDQAAELYIAILEDKPNSKIANHRMGIIRSRQSNFSSAADYFETAVASNSRDIELLSDYGYCCFLQGNLKKAQTLLLEATDIDSTDERTQNNLGLVYAKTMQTEKALSCFRLAGCDEVTARARLMKATGNTTKALASKNSASQNLLQPIQVASKIDSRQLTTNTPSPSKRGSHFDNPYTAKPVVDFAPNPPSLENVVHAGFVTNAPSQADQ